MSKQIFLLLDQTNCQIDPKSLKFRKNDYGKPEVCFSILNYYLSVTYERLHFYLAYVLFIEFLFYLGNQSKVLSRIFE